MWVLRFFGLPASHTNLQSFHPSHDDLCMPHTWRPYSCKKNCNLTLTVFQGLNKRDYYRCILGAPSNTAIPFAAETTSGPTMARADRRAFRAIQKVACGHMASAPVQKKLLLRSLLVMRHTSLGGSFAKHRKCAPESNDL